MDLETESTENLLRWRDHFDTSSQTRKAIEKELAIREVNPQDTGTLPLFGDEEWTKKSKS